MSEGMMSNLDRLVYMANQIARNLEAQGAEVAAATTGEHIARYWDPRMKAQIFAVAAGPSDLSPIAQAAVDLLRYKSEPGHRHDPMTFNAVDESSLHSDAG